MTSKSDKLVDEVVNEIVDEVVDECCEQDKSFIKRKIIIDKRHRVNNIL